MFSNISKRFKFSTLSLQFIILSTASGLIEDGNTNLYSIGELSSIGGKNPQLVFQSLESFIREPVVRDFSCKGNKEGIYIDFESGCEFYHSCEINSDEMLERKTFKCPEGQAFDEEAFECRSKNKVNCFNPTGNRLQKRSPKRYSNEEEDHFVKEIIDNDNRIRKHGLHRENRPETGIYQLSETGQSVRYHFRYQPEIYYLPDNKELTCVTCCRPKDDQSPSPIFVTTEKPAGGGHRPTGKPVADQGPVDLDDIEIIEAKLTKKNRKPWKTGSRKSNSNWGIRGKNYWYPNKYQQEKQKSFGRKNEHDRYNIV